MHQKSIVFLHIPKVAGTSMSQYCKDNDIIINYHLTRSDKYISLEEYKRHFNQNIYVFSFVRNPWDRLVSAYHFLAQGIGNDDDRLDSVKYLSKYRDFHEFVLSGLEEQPSLINQQIHFRTQKSWMIDTNGKIIVDFIGKYENLQNDFDVLTRSVGKPAYRLPHKNRSSHVDYKTYYTTETQAIVGEVYKEDIEAFGYSYE